MKGEQLQLRLSSDEKARIKAEAARAGEDVSKWVLRKLLPPAADELYRLIDALRQQLSERSLILADIHDFLQRQTADELRIALKTAIPSGLEPFEANYLAAMVETACTNKRILTPTWLTSVPPLKSPWFASNLKNLRLHLLTTSPPPFRRRNLFIDSTLGARI